MYILLLACLSLKNPSNGTVTCPRGDDAAPSTGDICTYTCNTGYKLIGSHTRTCQSNGSWSGSVPMCTS